MATTGPFGNTGNQAQEIEGVQLHGGGAVVPTALDAIAAGARIALPALKENHISNLQDEVKQDVGDVKKFLKLVRNPELLTSDFGVDAVENPVVRQALKDFVNIQDATKQGKLPGQFALERLEVIQNDAIASAPEFEKEIRLAMTAATGQDPSKTIFSQLLNDKAKPKTALQKEQERVEAEAFRHGVTSEAIIMAGNAEFRNNFAQNQFELKKRNGVATLRDLSESATTAAGTVFGKLLGQIQAEKTQFGGLRSDFGANVLTQFKLEKFKIKSQISGGMQGSGVDATAVEASMVALDKFEADLTMIVENNLLETLVADRNSLTKSLVLGEFMKNADDAAALSLGGGQLYLEFKKLFNEKDNPAMARLQQTLFSSAESKAAILKVTGGANTGDGRQQSALSFQLGMPTQGQVIKQFTKINDDDFEELPAQDKTARRIAAYTVLRTPEAAPEARKGAIKTLDDDHAWRAYDDSRALASALTNPDIAKRFVDLQTNQTGAMAFEYTTKVTGYEGFSSARLRVVNGVLTYSPVGTTGSTRTEADQEIPAFVERVNKAISISERYSRPGILPDIKFGGAEKYFETIKTAVAKSVEQGDKIVDPTAKKPIRRVVRGADGKLVFSEE